MVTPRWDNAQRQRLGVEKLLLDEYFPGRTVWHDQMDASKTKVDIALNTNDGTEYTLRIYLEEDFPRSYPVLTVVSPRLKLKNGDRFPENSTEFHTQTPVEGYPSICHFHPMAWTQDNTLFEIFMKGRIWLEAYSLHHRTGKMMNIYLKEFGCTPSTTPPPKKRSLLKRLRKGKE